MKKILLPVILLTANIASAQIDTLKPNLSFTGYAEVYYSYDFSNPGNHERPSFFYNFNRHNEVNLNLGFINASYTAKNVRANLGLMVGTGLSIIYLLNNPCSEIYGRQMLE